MTCYLRVSGTSLDIDTLLTRVSLETNKVWHKGDLLPFGDEDGNDEINDTSGASFLVSEAGMEDFGAQINDATKYLEANMSDMNYFSSLQDVDSILLDFGIELSDVSIHSDYLPLAFIKLASDAGVDIELSHYPAS